LAILGVLILISSAPTNLRSKVFDAVCLALISLTGPFCLLLAPAAVVCWWFRRSRWSIVLTSIVVAGCCVQVVTLAHYLPTCTPVNLLNPLTIRILAGQLFLFGTVNGGAIIANAPIGSTFAVEVGAVIVVTGLALVAYACWRGSQELRIFVLFGALVFLAIARRLHCDTGWNWPNMMVREFAVRYWYVPRLAVLAALASLIARKQPLWIRVFGAAALLAITIASLAHWQYPALPNFDWPRYAKRVEQSPPGTVINIPVNPPGWHLSLVKH
jgi:hypothetical protein